MQSYTHVWYVITGFYCSSFAKYSFFLLPTGSFAWQFWLTPRYLKTLVAAPDEVQERTYREEQPGRRLGGL
jgi:hypothetical protein